ncbi:MAG: hypothetical protein ACAI25_00380 [Planctomycetota bacterium]
MKRTGLLVVGTLGVASFGLALAVARGQDDPKAKAGAPDKADAPSKKSEASAAKAPDPSKATLVGEPLAAGSVKRDGLYPLDAGRTWRYELKTWLATSAAEEGAPEEAEAPRTHRMDVHVGEADKVEGKDVRCLEWKLDDATAQKAFYLDEGTSIVCVRRVLGTGDHKHDFLFTPAQPVLKGDLAVGSKWTWEGSVGPTKGKQTFEVLREEKLKAAGQELSTIVVRMNYTGDDESTGVSVKWLAPGVGLVREESEVKADQQIYRTLAVLTKFDTGKK